MASIGNAANLKSAKKGGKKKKKGITKLPDGSGFFKAMVGKKKTKKKPGK